MTGRWMRLADKRVAAATAVMILTACGAALYGDQQRANIIFIFADDWGWGDLSCHGHPYHWVSYAVVIEPWKLVANRDLSYVELYDLVADPLEKNDLKEKHPGTVKGLTQMIAEWQKTLPESPASHLFSSERVKRTQ